MKARSLLSSLLTFGAAASLVLTAPTAAHASDPDRGLFGAQDPTYDGVYRQSAAILGLAAVDAHTPKAAIGWLVRQQCPDGSYASYRADLAAACPASDPVNYVGKDTNSTAMAALALRAVGHGSAARHAEKWLIAEQLPSGGWSWFIGAAADTASTGLVLAALRDSEAPGARKAVRKAMSWMRSVVIGCAGAPDERFGLPFMPGTDDPGVASFFGSTQGLVGLAGTVPVPARKQAKGAGSARCDKQGHVADARKAVGRWVAGELQRNHGVIPSLYEPDKPDWNSTAVAALGLISSGTARAQTGQAVRQLKTHVTAAIATTGGDSTGALGGLLLLAHAHRDNARDFGGINLVRRLLATVQ